MEMQDQYHFYRLFRTLPQWRPGSKSAPLLFGWRPRAGWPHLTA